MRDRLPPRSIIAEAVATLRKSWPDDGAEGESVHIVCDALELVWAENDALWGRASGAERDRDRAVKTLQSVVARIDGVLAEMDLETGP